MPVSFTLPIVEKPTSVKDMIFTLLMTQYPLSLIEMLNALKKQYRISVSFQAVRKAVLQLEEAKVLVKDGKDFSISRDWILELIKFGNTLQKNYFKSSDSKTNPRLEIGPNVTVYTLSKLVDLDYVWNGIIREALSKSGAPKIVTFRAVHFWFLIATLAQETELIKELLKKGIQVYNICYGNTPLDKWAVQMYKDLGVHCMQLPKPKGFQDGLYIGTYGDCIIQANHPPVLSKKMDEFFISYKKIGDSNLAHITDIVTTEIGITLTVQNDPVIAGSFRENAMREFEK